MDIASIGALALYAFVMSITPGPNNLMLMTSGLIFGMQRTVPHLLGIPCGVIVQLVAIGLGLGAVFAVEPRLQTGLKVVGTLYLLWLAWTLWRSAGLEESAMKRPISFLEAAMFQFVNPKAWLMAITVIAAFAAPGEGFALRLAIVCLTFTVVAVPCMVVWAGFGAGLRQVLRDPRRLLLVNRTMAVLAAATAAMFWL